MPACYCHWTFLLPSFRNGLLNVHDPSVRAALFSLIVLKDSIRVFDLIIMINLAGGSCSNSNHSKSRQFSLWCFIESRDPSHLSWATGPANTHDLWHSLIVAEISFIRFRVKLPQQKNISIQLTFYEKQFFFYLKLCNFLVWLMFLWCDFPKIRVKTITKNHGLDGLVEADPLSVPCNKHIFCHSYLTWPQFVQAGTQTKLLPLLPPRFAQIFANRENSPVMILRKM